MDIQNLQERVVRDWPFDAKEYPGFDRLSAAEQQLFAIRHVAAHWAKAVGAVEAELEKFDHGKEVNFGALKETTQKQFVNILRMAALLKIDETALAARVTE